MKSATAHLVSASPYSQSRHYAMEIPKLNKETAADYEKRTWRFRLHVNGDGFVEMPAMSFKNALAEAAKYISMQVPGKGKATYTKHFEAGILVPENIVLPIKAEDVPGQWLMLPSDGKRGSGSRVPKCMPMIPSWEAHVEFLILDDAITEEVFTKHLEEAGKFIGVGSFRPRNNGICGRFRVSKIAWKES